MTICENHDFGVEATKIEHQCAHESGEYYMPTYMESNFNMTCDLCATPLATYLEDCDCPIKSAFLDSQENQGEEEEEEEWEGGWSDSDAESGYSPSDETSAGEEEEEEGGEAL